MDAFVLKQWFLIGETAKETTISSVSEEAKVVSLDLAWVASWVQQVSASTSSSSTRDSLKEQMSNLLSTAFGSEFPRRGDRERRQGVREWSAPIRVELVTSSFEAVAAAYKTLRADFPSLEEACGVPAVIPTSLSLPLPGSSALSYFGFTSPHDNDQEQEHQDVTEAEGKSFSKDTLRSLRGGSSATTNARATMGAAGAAVGASASAAPEPRSRRALSASRCFALLDLFLTPPMPGRRIQGHNCLPTPFARSASCDRKY